MSAQIRGVEELAKLSRALKEAGERGLQRELSKGIGEALKPLKDDLRRSARATLPERGGLAERVARSQIRTVRANSARRTGVRVKVTNMDDYALRRLDRGQLRHPVPGTDKWVDQRVPSGWWTNPTTGAQPAIARQIELAVKRVAAKLGAIR